MTGGSTGNDDRGPPVQLPLGSMSQRPRSRRSLLASLPPARRMRTLDELRQSWASIAPLDGSLPLFEEPRAHSPED